MTYEYFMNLARKVLWLVSGLGLLVGVFNNESWAEWYFGTQFVISTVVLEVRLRKSR
jgi:hypothetical protein